MVAVTRRSNMLPSGSNGMRRMTPGMKRYENSLDDIAMKFAGARMKDIDYRDGQYYANGKLIPINMNKPDSSLRKKRKTSTTQEIKVAGRKNPTSKAPTTK